MASTQNKMKCDDLTYTQIIDPTLGGNLPKPKNSRKATTKKTSSNTSTAKKPTTKENVQKTSSKSSSTKATGPKKTMATKKSSNGKTDRVMKYDDLTYTQIIDPTLGGNLPKNKSDKKIETNIDTKEKTSSKAKMKYDDLTYTQIIDPTLGGNLPKAKKEVSLPKAEEIKPKDIMLDPETDDEEYEGLSMLISAILVMALIVIGIILAAHLIK